MPGTPQPKSGQHIPGSLKATYPTPGNDVTYSSELAYNVEDYLQTIYGNPPPEGTNPDQMLVSETVIDWQLVRRLYCTDRTNEDAYNASISYGQEATLFPTFTRDYVVRRYNYTPKTKLAPLVGIITATVTAGGSGYNPDTTTVSVSGGTGSGGAVTAIISNGIVTNLAISAVGTYTAAPNLTITDSGGSGTGATGVAAVQPQTALLTKEDALRQPENPLDGLYIFVRRIYETLPGPIVAGTHTDDHYGIVVNYTKQVVAAGTVTSGIVGAGVIGLSIVDGGHGFTTAPTLSITGGGGSGATATATVDTSNAGKIGSVTVAAAGGGFTSVPSVVLSGDGSGASAVVQLVPTNINSIILTAGGTGYTDIPVVSFGDAAAGGIGSGATAVATLTPTAIDTVTPVANGSGYTMATVTVTGGGGTGAAITANIVGTAITSYTVNNAGNGYTSIPTVTVTGDGTGATAVALLVGTSVATIALTSTGSLYGVPFIIFSGGGGGSAAAGTALLAPTTIRDFLMISSGSGYTNATAAISGGGGSGAIGTPVILTGFINAVMVTAPGSGYTNSPTVGVSGGGGTGADIRAIIGSLTFVDYEPVTAIKGIKMTQTVDLTTLPTDKSFPITYRVTFKDTGFATIVFAFDENYASGMQENTFRGGSGPVRALKYERWMTESAYQAYVSPFGVSITGKSRAYTLVNSGIYKDVAYVFTFRPSPLDEGTGAGLVDLTAEAWRLKVYKVNEIVLTANV